MAEGTPAGRRQPVWFLVLFALAAGGGSIAYVPLLTVLLPLEITEMFAGANVPALATVTFFGAIMASLANILFGWLSDRFWGRVPWIIGGLASSSALLIAIGYASSLTEIIMLVMAWQLALNMMLGPLVAWAGDCFPDSQKGVLGGALSLAPAMGALSGSLVTFDMLVAAEYRLWLVAALVVIFVLPVVIFGRGRALPELMEPEPDAQRDVVPHAKGTVIRMWLARFLVQISEAGLFAFLLFWLRSLSQEFHENTAANIFSIVLVLSVPLTLLAGRWSDTARRPILPLSLAALVSAMGLAIMAASGGLQMAIAGYVLFSISATIFLSLHTAQTLRVLPEPRNRGRDMGLFNLTNTVPSLVMPGLTIALVPGFGFTALFAVFAAAALIAALLLATIPIRK